MKWRNVALITAWAWPIGFIMGAGLALLIFNPQVPTTNAQLLGLLAIIGAAYIVLAATNPRR